MLKGGVFPYGITLREGGSIDITPVAEVSFTLKEGETVSLFLLIDSGAAVSALPMSDASALGLSLESAPEVAITGIDGKLMRGWRRTVPVRIGNVQKEIPVVFLENEYAPRILGREGVFESFEVIFEEYNRRSALIWNNTRDAISVRKILDRVE